MNFGCCDTPQIRNERNGEPHPEGSEIVRHNRQHARTHYWMHRFEATVARIKASLDLEFTCAMRDRLARRGARACAISSKFEWADSEINEGQMPIMTPAR